MGKEVNPEIDDRGNRRMKENSYDVGPEMYPQNSYENINASRNNSNFSSSPKKPSPAAPKKR